MLNQIKTSINNLTEANKASTQNKINELVKKLFENKNNTSFNGNAIFGESQNTITITSPQAGSSHNQSDYTDKNITEKNGITGLTKLQAEEKGYTVVTTANELQEALKNNEKIMLFGNINLNGVSWDIIENYTNELEGNGYTISNYSGENALIANANGATIQNLTLENVDLKGAGSGGGALVNTAYSMAYIFAKQR